jgi:SNF2 family DNA or RNA helicase
VEEKIMKLQNKKKQLAQDVIRTDASFFQALSKEELVGMLEE